MPVSTETEEEKKEKEKCRDCGLPIMQCIYYFG